MIIYLIPIVKNKGIFERVKAAGIRRSQRGVVLTQYNRPLRSPNRGAFTRSNMPLFFTIGIILLMATISCNGAIEDHYRKLEGKSRYTPGIQGIDYIYLINLDARPEKFLASVTQLNLYNIAVERFSAIYGWGLSTAVINDVGLRYAPGMWPGLENALHFPFHWNGASQFVKINDSCYGLTFFSGWTTPGAIGCTLSHLSVLYDAYTSGYKTIWVLEDDIDVVQDPHILVSLIEELDSLTDKEWDILYTDHDYLTLEHPDVSIFKQLPMKWRPDMPFFDLEPLLEHTSVGAHFFKIGSRNRTHSYLIRRSGMKKILDFYHEQRMFLPLDHELFFIPQLTFYVTRDSIVTSNETVSDTKNRYFP